jgi:NTP pyrophosphatase (non-canonical NTP hydrolase)
MRLHDYQKLAMRTCSSPDKNNINSSKLQLLHACLGICSEVGEIVEDLNNTKNVFQECGDVSWYCAIGLDAIGFDMENIDTSLIADDPWEEIVVHAGIACDCVKRHVFYQVELDEDKFTQAIGCVMACVESISLDTGNELEVALEKNIEKLRIRYPDKFSTDNAVNRDIKKEGKVF